MAKVIEELEGQALVDALIAMGAIGGKLGKSKRKSYTISCEVVAAECSTCKIVKMIKAFTKDSRRAAGIGGPCLICNRVRSRKYTEENREKEVLRKRKYREIDKEDENRRARERYRENRDEILSRYRDRYAKNIKKERERSRRYYLANKEKELMRMRKFRRESPDWSRRQVLRRRALRNALPENLTESQYKSVMELRQGMCALCSSNRLHADHVIPLAIGHGGTIYGNMIPLDATLNQSKNDAHIFEWFDESAERFGLQRAKFDALIEYLADANEMTPQEYRAYVDWCFDNPRIIDEAGALVFRDGPINERNNNERKAIA